MIKTLQNKLAKARKNKKGFTLVELIVVIVILAILIGVTIGGIYRYVGQSRVNTDENNASSMISVLSTIQTDQTVYNEITAGSADATLVEITVSSTGGSVTTGSDAVKNAVNSLIPDLANTKAQHKDYKVTGKISSNKDSLVFTETAGD